MVSRLIAFVAGGTHEASVEAEGFAYPGIYAG